MAKFHVIANFCKDLRLETIEHDNVVMENKAGKGGGLHLLRDIWDSRQDDESSQNALHSLVAQMIHAFKKLKPDVVIKNHRIEHRVYILDEEKFVGRIHDDSCEYSLLLYYRIDSDIRGGTLNFYDDDAEKITDSHVPSTGDLVIFAGVHALGEVYAVKKAIRSVVIVHINSED